MSSKAITRVTVLNGGPSVEREVSLVSGNEIASALRGEGYIVSIIDADENLAPKITASNPDVVFNALHGRWGEDGCVQGLLEWMQIPYTHSGVYSSALAMDKEKTKDVYRAAGLPVAASMLVSKSEILTPLFSNCLNEDGLPATLTTFCLSESQENPSSLLY